MGVLSAVGAVASAISNGCKAIAAYLGLVQRAKDVGAGRNEQALADDAASMKGDASARKIEADNAAAVSGDSAELDRRLRASFAPGSAARRE